MPLNCSLWGATPSGRFHPQGLQAADRQEAHCPTGAREATLGCSQCARWPRNDGLLREAPIWTRSLSDFRVIAGRWYTAVAIRSPQCQLQTARGAVPARRETTMRRPAAKNSISRRRQIIPVCLLCHFHKNFPPCAGPPQPPKSNFLKNPTFSPKFPASPRPPAREHNSTAPRPPSRPPMGDREGISCVKPGVFHSLHRFFHSPPRLWKTPVEIPFSLHKTFRQETTESALFSPSQFSQRPLFPAKKSS